MAGTDYSSAFSSEGCKERGLLHIGSTRLSDDGLSPQGALYHQSGS